MNALILISILIFLFVSSSFRSASIHHSQHIQLQLLAPHNMPAQSRQFKYIRETRNANYNIFLKNYLHIHKYTHLVIKISVFFNYFISHFVCLFSSLLLLFPPDNWKIWILSLFCSFETSAIVSLLQRMPMITSHMNEKTCFTCNCIERTPPFDAQKPQR